MMSKPKKSEEEEEEKKTQFSFMLWFASGYARKYKYQHWN
jgi:hypothetical protein